MSDLRHEKYLLRYGIDQISDPLPAVDGNTTAGLSMILVHVRYSARY